MSRIPRQPRAQATVAAIVEAGFICVARHGTSGTTTRHVAEVAGISVGSLYEYFPNKEAIYAAMQQRFLADLVAVLQPQLAVISKLDIPDAVRGVLNPLQDFLQQHDARYLRYARNALNLDLRDSLEPVIRLLGDLVLQYLMQHPEYARLPRFAAMTYIFIHGGLFTVTHHLSDPNPPISFDELVDGLAVMVDHYVQREMSPNAD